MNLLIHQLQCWRDSNDIDSPSHNTYMEDCFEELEDDISPTDISEFRHLVVNIFLFIKDLN